MLKAHVVMNLLLSLSLVVNYLSIVHTVHSVTISCCWQLAVHLFESLMNLIGILILINLYLNICQINKDKLLCPGELFDRNIVFHDNNPS